MASRRRRRLALGENTDSRQALRQLEPRCACCGARFSPVRPGQRHCRPSCARHAASLGLFDQAPAFKNGECER